ncbi:MAG: VCBS repeat-containing protein [Myxococcota bacterium]
MRSSWWWVLVGVGSLGCPSDGGDTAGGTETGLTAGSGTPGNTSSGGASGTVDASGAGSEASVDSTGASTGNGIKFDLARADDVEDTGPPVDACSVLDDMNAVGECDDEAPPDSFEPVEQWSYTPAGEAQSYVTPLVANLTDDNDDGVIDLCDVPDVVLVAGASTAGYNAVGHIYVLDGATGTLHFQVPAEVHGNVTPAIGDVDDDGIPEIATLTPAGAFVLFEHDGTQVWETPTTWINGEQSQPLSYSAAAAIANLDNAGAPEIIVGNQVINADGTGLLVLPDVSGQWSATAAADMDGDGDLEVVLGHAVYQHDGALLWDSGLAAGYPQIADLDGDMLPEVLLTNTNGLALIEHDGTVAFSGLTPTMNPAGFTTWLRPATIHDFDGDGAPEFATSSANDYTVYEADATILWTAPVQDSSGIAAGTAFDFLGDGVAEAMYADETNMFVFDGTGAVLLQVPRGSGTLSEYPTVADLDNDGSAEIAFVSNSGIAPTLQVTADVQDRWIQARRIWNQHTYHVTNVREDGTIPVFEAPHWESLNTFRTNAQIQGGELCVPRPPG